MPATTPGPQSRPHGAPAYYLARPASLWITALRQRPHQRLPHRTPADPAEAAPARPAAD
jgi:hypothetical protein